MIFQTLDDKSQCVGLYADGQLFFDDIPDEITKTWKYTGSLKDADVQYAWLMTQGASLMEAAPDHLRERLEHAQKRLRAYVRSFSLAKINLRDHCIFDLVPQDFLKEFCEIKNQITAHVFETYEKPECYDHLSRVHKLLFKLKYQNLNLNSTDCKRLFMSSIVHAHAKKLLAGPHHVDYNLFGTITGRLATYPNSFPILTLQRGLRKLIKPHNDWLISLDYNGAELRTLLALSAQEQPAEDIHEWNMKNIFELSLTREEAKTTIFSWLYNPDSKNITTDVYNRDTLLKEYYDNGYLTTPFGRHLSVDRRRAFNYLIQSTTADIVLDRAVAIDKALEGTDSWVSHIVHDEIVLDMTDKDRKLIPEIKKLFATNMLDTFIVNLKAGRDYLDLKDLKL
ncbi:hypothetical protein CMI47_15595 [Candidatus Pacearchaeota archaeon]|nr:hypothetical protein [Candidatus Pacearchaeota archaeon]